MLCDAGAGGVLDGPLAKPMMVTLPFVLLLVDVWLVGARRPGGETTTVVLVREKVPLFVLAACRGDLPGGTGGRRSRWNRDRPASGLADAFCCTLGYLGQTGAAMGSGRVDLFPQKLLVVAGRGLRGGGWGITAQLARVFRRRLV